MYYLSAGNFNIISVDWRHLAHNEWYPTSLGNTVPVGRGLGVFIKYLVQFFDDLQLEDFHVIGFSLGAHVAGNAGYHLGGG